MQHFASEQNDKFFVASTSIHFTAVMQIGFPFWQLKRDTRSCKGPLCVGPNPLPPSLWKCELPLFPRSYFSQLNKVAAVAFRVRNKRMPRRSPRQSWGKWMPPPPPPALHSGHVMPQHKGRQRGWRGFVFACRRWLAVNVATESKVIRDPARGG